MDLFSSIKILEIDFDLDYLDTECKIHLNYIESGNQPILQEGFIVICYFRFSLTYTEKHYSFQVMNNAHI